MLSQPTTQNLKSQLYQASNHFPNSLNTNHILNTNAVTTLNYDIDDDFFSLTNSDKDDDKLKFAVPKLNVTTNLR